MDDLQQAFAHVPWWVPLIVLVALCTGILIAADLRDWTWPTTKLFLMAVTLIIGLTGVAGQFEKLRLRRLLATTRGLDELRLLSWTAFEQLVLAAYRESGWGGSLTRPGADGGVDVILEKGGDKVFVQCKHWKSRNVGVESIRALKGSMATEGVTKGIFVTTGSFSHEAQRYAHSSGITTVDGPGVLELVRGVYRPKVADIVGASSETIKSPLAVSIPTAAAAPPCPRCESVMVMRQGPRGAFWGCPQFPRCRGTVNITE
jgi:restriction system protein